MLRSKSVNTDYPRGVFQCGLAQGFSILRAEWKGLGLQGLPNHRPGSNQGHVVRHDSVRDGWRRNFTPISLLDDRYRSARP